MSNTNYGEVLCQAVDEIVKRRLEGISYDQTILCTITDDSNKKQGVYIVTNNNTVKFEAFSDNTSYHKNDNVYVQIPGGDWNQQKIIVAKKTNNKEEPFIYKRPFESLVDLTGNIIGGASASKLPMAGLVANGSQNSIVLWTYNKEEKDNDKNNLPLHEQGEALRDFTRLGIQAGFKSLISTFYYNNTMYRVSSGDYGLKLTITANVDESSSDAEYVVYLNCADMNGNPYDFQTYYTQEKVIDVSQIGKIKTMQLEFYQNGDFKSADGTMIPNQDFLGNEIASNLFVNDAYITLGYDSSEFSNEMVRIYTLNSPTYSKNAESNEKQIQLRWIHKTEEGNFISVSNSTDMDYEIRWYRYELGHSSADEYSGVYWKRHNESSTFNTTLIPDVTLQTEQIKAIVLHDGKIYRSNILIFENEDEVINKATIDMVQALSVVCVDREIDGEEISSYGNYRIYNSNGSLLDKAQASHPRKWIPYFKAVSQDEPTELVEAESIEWIIPIKRTMIVIDEIDSKNLPNEEPARGENENTVYWKESGENERLHIKRFGNNNDLSEVNAQSYKIKNQYSQNYSDNTIQCKVVKDKITYSTVKELTFGIAGTTGSDCTLIIDFENGQTAVTPGGDPITAIVKLYDYENNEIDISDRNIEWDWKVSDNAITMQNSGQKVNLAFNNTYSLGPHYNILSATLNWGDGKLVAYLPVPIRSSIDYAYISGATEVIYNSDGGILSYYGNPYILYNRNASEVNDVVWSIHNGNEDEIVYSPRLVKNGNSYYLRPLDLYVENTCEKLCVVGKSGGTTIWSQPILVVQNKYPSFMLNRWDGSLSVGDTDGGTVLAPRVGAGKKNSDGSFSGVLIGDWATELGEGLSTRSTGLYGFNNGQQSYGFREDGTAFIGKESAGRIVFDGNSGVIESAMDKGMSINLSDGSIKSQNFSLSIGTVGENSTISITTDKEKKPLQIGSKFYVEWDGTVHATEGNFSGQIEATSGKFTGEIHATSGEFTGAISSSSIDNGAFTVDTNGNVKASSIEITGGLISYGGSTLNSSGFSSSNANITGGSLDINNGQFTVNSNGHMIAKSAEIIGSLSTSNGVFTVDTEGNMTATSATINGGSLNINNNFQVSIDGVLKATGASISGALIVENGGKLGNLKVEDGKIKSDYLIIEEASIKSALGAASGSYWEINNYGTVLFNGGKISSWKFDSEIIENTWPGDDKKFTINRDGTIETIGLKIEQGAIQAKSLTLTDGISAKSLDITDKISLPTSSTIGDWTIEADQLKSNNGNIILNHSNGNVSATGTISANSLNVTNFGVNSLSVNDGAIQLGSDGAIKANSLNLTQGGMILNEETLSVQEYTPYYESYHVHVTDENGMIKDSTDVVVGIECTTKEIQTDGGRETVVIKVEPIYSSLQADTKQYTDKTIKILRKQ